jgi:hypothetical protein
MKEVYHSLLVRSQRPMYWELAAMVACRKVSKGGSIPREPSGLKWLWWQMARLSTHVVD